MNHFLEDILIRSSRFATLNQPRRRSMGSLIEQSVCYFLPSEKKTLIRMRLGCRLMIQTLETITDDAGG